MTYQERIVGKQLVKSSKLFFLSLFVITWIGCKQSSNDMNKSEIKSDNNKIDMGQLIKVNKELLVEQLKQGVNYSNDEIGIDIDYDFTERELKETFNIMTQILRKNSFIKLNQDRFVEKVKNVFGRTLDMNSSKEYIYINFFEKCFKTVQFKKNDGVNYFGFFIDKKERFITDIYYIPELVDYKRMFPELLQKENLYPDRTIREGKDDYYINKWSEIKGLNEEREAIIKKVIHQNKYLFNDSKASLNWLMLNDVPFLKGLVKEFGYVADNDLLRWVIDETPVRDAQGMNNITDYLRLFYIITCDKQLVLHQETMDMITSYNTEQHFQDVSYLIMTLRLDEEYLEDFSFPQKAKLYAYFFELIRKLGNDDFASVVAVGTFYKFSALNKQYDEEFKQHNYYGFKELEYFWEEAKETGNGIQHVED